MEKTKTLHLNLKKKWFDMILAGKKFVEYRDISEYWIRRLFYLGTDFDFDSGFDEIISKFNNKYTTLSSMCVLYKIQPKKIDTITFSNGYAKDRKQFVIELKSFDYTSGIEKWGAEKDKIYFCLHLGKLINKINC